MIVLGIDQAATSGWAIHVGGPKGRIVAHGVARTWEARADVLTQALERAGGVIGEVLVVFENHAGISLSKGSREEGKAPTRNTAVILGLGAARGRWEEALDRRGHPELMRLSVEPKAWRARVLGLALGASRERCKHAALEWASAALYKPIADDNEAEAICIASWGALDGVSVLEGRRRHARAVARARAHARKQKSLTFGGG